MSKINEKLNEMKESLNNLKSQHHSKGEDNLTSCRNLIERIIGRIYPEKDAKELKNKLVDRFWILTGGETDTYWQNSYLGNIDRAIMVIDTILEESELFGFEDFKPIKEKTETEVKIGSDKFGFWRRKKTK